MVSTMKEVNKDIVADTQVVVLMGGLGTRLGLKGIPKAMALINGHPFFDYQLKLLKRWRFYKFLFLVGHQAEYIEDYYGDGSKWQVDIQYSYDGKEQLGTGGALRNAAEKLEEDFLLIYGDSFMDVDYQEVVYRYWLEKPKGKLALMAILENENCYDRSNVIYQKGEIVLYDKVNISDEMRYIDYGVSMLSKDVLTKGMDKECFDLAEILTFLSKNGKLAGQVVTKRFYEIGSPASLQEFCEYAEKRFTTKSKAVFFDRDGVINELVYNDDIDQIDSPFSKEDFIYKQNVVSTLLSVQKMGFLIFIVTNQPAAAKGKVSLSSIYDLNTWMIQDLKTKGVFVEAVNVCPHHPTGNQRSKVPFLIRKCKCRKPEVGLITDLLEVYHIDRENSYMVGDSYTDIIAGRKAGLRTILIGKMKCDACQKLQEDRPDKIIRDIGELENILGE